MSSTSQSFRFLLNLLKAAQKTGTIALFAVTVWESHAVAQSASPLRDAEASPMKVAVLPSSRNDAAGIQQMAGRALKQASGLSRSSLAGAVDAAAAPRLVARVASEPSVAPAPQDVAKAPVSTIVAQSAAPTALPQAVEKPFAESIQSAHKAVAPKAIADARGAIAPLRTPLPPAPTATASKMAFVPPSPILNQSAPLATSLPIVAPAAYPTNPLYMPMAAAPVYNMAQAYPAPGAYANPVAYANPSYAAPVYAQVPMMQGYAQPGYAQPNYAQSGYAQPNYAQSGYAQSGYAQMPMAQPMPMAPTMAYPQAAYPQAAYPQPYAQPAYAQPYGAAYGAPMPYGGYAAPAMPPMPSPYAALQSPYASAQLTPPVSRMRSAAPMAQYAAAPSYAAPNYAAPMPYAAAPQYGMPMQQMPVQQPYGMPMQPQYAPQYQQPAPMPQYQQPAPMPQYQQPAPMPQLGADPQAVIGNPLNAPLAVPVSPSGTIGGRTDAAALKGTQSSLIRSTATNKPSLTLQGVYQYQADESSARARISGMYPLSSRALFGATLDVSSGKGFSDTPNDGFNVNELFFATSLAEIPNLRFTVGQLDLTSYFDRNSFAKDGASHFFNPTFQTNPALAAAGLGSRPGLLVNWSLSDNIEAKAATFSAARGLGDFSLNGFAGEVGLRYGNAILRGTYVTGRDSGNKDSFKDAFSINRGNNQFGLLRDDRESGYGVNGEVFIPKLKMGLFARYGRYNNLDLSEGADTYGAGLSFLDVFSRDDRLGLAYGSALTNERLRRQAGRSKEDALELFYDFRFLPNLRMGLSLQQRNDFSEIVAGVRVKTEFDITPKGRQVQ